MRRQVRSEAAGQALLKAYAPTPPGASYPGVPVAMLKDSGLASPAAKDSTRTRFGRAISLARIETALLLAHSGAMMQLTDLSRETVETDPHLASVLIKRFGAVSSLPYEIRPATGYGIDKARALFYATVAREQIQNLAHFRRMLRQLAWGLFDARSAIELFWSLVVGPADPKFGKVKIAVTESGWIHPRRLSFGPNRELIVTEEKVATSTRFSSVGVVLDAVSPGKFIVWQPQLFGEYQEREGLAPRCMYWSFFKRFGQRDRMILLELFGKPWRIIEVDQESNASDDDLTAADDAADGLGAAYTARMPRGTKLNVIQPGRTAGQVHQEVITESDRQISKLVLGQTGTTDGVPAGLNSNQASVMQDEQLMILTSDAAELSEIIETQLIDPIIMANFGPEALPHAPTFVLRSDLPVDRVKELERLQSAVDVGLEISLAEAYEVSGFRQPERTEPIVRKDQPPTSPLAPIPPAARAVIVWPEGSSPPAGEQLPITPQSAPAGGARDGSGVTVGSADQAKIITVNEARAGQGLPPLTLPGGAPDPNGDLTVAEYEAKLKGEDVSAPDGSTGTSGDGLKPELVSASLAAIAAKTEGVELMVRKSGDQWCVYSDDGSRKFGCYSTPEEADARLREIEYFKHTDAADSIAARGAASELVLAADVRRVLDLASDKVCCELRQPDTVNGTVEDLIDRGTRELQLAVNRWADEYVNAFGEAESAGDITRIANRVAEQLDARPFARALERNLVHSVALGALDSWFDDENPDGETVAPPTFAAEQAADIDPAIVVGYGVAFSKMKFDRALRIFREKNVLPRALFDQLSAEAKRKSFTVAALTQTQMLHLVHAELARHVGAGADFRSFAPSFKKRLESAGFTAPTVKAEASYIQTVFRTNVLGAYNAGRHERMSQPEVVRARPYWQIRTVSDHRRRPTHAQADGVIMRADDPFWKRAYPPFGFSCRCRVVSLSEKQASKMTISTGSSINYLPDPGFTSGIPTLLAAVWPRSRVDAVMLDLEAVGQGSE